MLPTHTISDGAFLYSLRNPSSCTHSLSLCLFKYSSLAVFPHLFSGAFLCLSSPLSIFLPLFLSVMFIFFSCFPLPLSAQSSPLIHPSSHMFSYLTIRFLPCTSCFPAPPSVRLLSNSYVPLILPIFLSFYPPLSVFLPHSGCPEFVSARWRRSG